jgi:replicative DNA helicase
MISKVIAEESITEALAAGVQSDWFEDADHRETFAWMVDFHARYGKSPTAQALATQFPLYRLVKVPEPYEYYIDHIREVRTRAILVDTIIDANTAVTEDDPVLAARELSKGLLRLGTEVSSLTDEDAVQTMRERFTGYKTARENVGKITGITTGFPTLDLCTGGYHDGQFIVLGGTAKQGKSWLLMAMAIAAQEQGKRVLFVSFEMSVQEQLARLDGMTCGINSNRLLRGDLSDLDFKKLYEGMRSRKGMAPFVISADITATTTVSGLAGKIEQHQPDVVVVDGAYLMQSEGGEPPGSTQAMTAVSRGLKRLAQRIKKPVLATTQTLPSKVGKDGHTVLNSFGWTSAWVQDADLILAVERDEDATTLIKLRVVAGRNVSPREIGLNVNWEESTLEEINVGGDYDDMDDDA